MILLAAVATSASLTFSADADAFGGRGFARRQVRRAYYAPTYAAAPVVVQRVYTAPVVSVYRAPVYYRPPVSVQVGRYGSYYGTGYYGPSYPAFGYPVYGGGVSIGIGW